MFLGSGGVAINILEEEKAQAWKHSEELELLRKQLNLWIERGQQGDAGETTRQLEHYKVHQIQTLSLLPTPLVVLPG